MGPDPRDRTSARRGKRAAATAQAKPSGLNSDDAHDVVYFRRHRLDDPREQSPGREFLSACPVKVRATFRAVLVAVAAAPPKRFAGGGYWEAMHGGLSGRYEVRVDGPGRAHYRLFCLLDYAAVGVERPLLVVIDGATKAFRTTFSAAVYHRVQALGDEYLARNPRSLSEGER
jgi:hypothetical protein